MTRKLFRFLPPILWMAFMFYMSSRSGLPTVSTPAVDYLSKKSAHVFEYIILNILWIIALGRKKIGTALLLSLSYAFFDETHQLFTPTRTGQLRDVGIDFIGITLSSLLALNLYPWKLTSRHLSKKHGN